MNTKILILFGLMFLFGTMFGLGIGFQHGTDYASEKTQIFLECYYETNSTYDCMQKAGGTWKITQREALK